MKFRWFWGLFFIVGAALIIVNQLGYLTGISLFSLICTLLLIPIIIKSIAYRSFAGILFPIALLGIIYAEPLGITALSPWPLLAAALFGSIGLSLIFHKSHHKYNYDQKEGNPENFDQVINSPDSEVVDCRVKFGSSIKYVNSENFQKGIFECSFGAMKVYFDHAKLSEDGAEIYIDMSFSGATFYIPKTWNLVKSVDCSLGGIEEKNLPAQQTGGIPVKLIGNVKFSGIEIIYV